MPITGGEPILSRENRSQGHDILMRRQRLRSAPYSMFRFEKPTSISLKYIEMASHGSEIIVTKRGRPVARIAPIEVGGLMSDAEKFALERSRARMRQGYSLGGGSFDREAAHAR